MEGGLNLNLTSDLLPLTSDLFTVRMARAGEPGLTIFCEACLTFRRACLNTGSFSITKYRPAPGTFLRSLPGSRAL